MKKQRILILLIITMIALAAFSGCSMLLSEPNPSITVFESSDYDFSASKGGTVTLTIGGTTIDGMPGLITNYTGTLKLFYSAGYGSDYAMQIGSTIEFDGVFSEEIPLTLASVGEYELTAEVSDTYDNVVTKELTVRFYPSILDGVDVITAIDDSSAPNRIEESRSSTATEWFSMVMNDTDADVRECFHWGDSGDEGSSTSYTADVFVTIYDHAGNLIAGPRDNGWWASSAYAPDIDTVDDGIEMFCNTDYVVGETLFVKVTGSTGTYGFYTYCPGY